MQRTEFDVVIVGSGAAGGTLAAHLARRGARVAIVEGGPRVNTRTDFNTHAMPFDYPNRHIPTMRPGKPGFDSDRPLKSRWLNRSATAFQSMVLPPTPRVRSESKPGLPGRMVGMCRFG